MNRRDGPSNVEATRACLLRDRAGFRGACDEDVCEVRVRGCVHLAVHIAGPARSAVCVLQP